jgi:hypothetical protein
VRRKLGVFDGWIAHVVCFNGFLIGNLGLELLPEVLLSPLAFKGTLDELLMLRQEAVHNLKVELPLELLKIW